MKTEFCHLLGEAQLYVYNKRVTWILWNHKNENHKFEAEELPNASCSSLYILEWSPTKTKILTHLVVQRQQNQSTKILFWINRYLQFFWSMYVCQIGLQTIWGSEEGLLAETSATNRLIIDQLAEIHQSEQFLVLFINDVSCFFPSCLPPSYPLLIWFPFSHSLGVIVQVRYPCQVHQKQPLYCKGEQNVISDKAYNNLASSF